MSRTPAALLLALVMLGAAGCTRGPGVVDGSCGPQRTAVSVVRASDGGVRWRRTLPHPREDPPSVSGRHVLLRGCGATVLDLETGRTEGRHSTDGNLVGLAGSYLVTADDGDVTAEPIGHGPAASASSQPPYEEVAVAGDLVLTVLGTELTALRLSQGFRERWRATLPTLSRASFRLAGDLLVVRAGDGSVYGVADGAVRWRAVPSGGALGYGPVLAAAPDVVVVSADDAVPVTQVVAIDGRTGRERWRARVTTNRSAGEWATTDGVLAGPLGDRTVGIDLRSGRRLWVASVPATQAVGVGDAFVTAADGSVLGLDSATGQVRWRLATGHPALLAGSPSSGEVVVLDSPPVPHGFDDCC